MVILVKICNNSLFNVWIKGGELKNMDGKKVCNFDLGVNEVKSGEIVRRFMKFSGEHEFDKIRWVFCIFLSKWFFGMKLTSKIN